jgi:hypothetical protein
MPKTACGPQQATEKTENNAAIQETSAALKYFSAVLCGLIFIIGYVSDKM